MPLKSMALTKADRKAREKRCEIPSLGDKYPYGLRIELNNDAVKKLGLSSLPKAGKRMKLVAEVRVIGSRMNQRDGGETERNLDLQIEKMDLTSTPGSALEAVNEGIKAAGK